MNFMTVDLIRDVNIGTILRNKENERYIVVKKFDGWFRNKINCYVGLVEIEGSKNNLIIDLREKEFLIDGELSKTNCLKRQLLGMEFGERINWDNYIVYLKDLNEGSYIISYNESYEKGKIYMKEGKKYYVYNILTSRYIVNKREIKNPKRYLVGTLLNNIVSYEDDLTIINTKNNLNKNKIEELSCKAMDLIIQFCNKINKMGTINDLELITIHNMKREELHKEVSKFVFRFFGIKVTYKYNKSVEYTEKIIDDECYEYETYYKFLLPLIDKLYNYILDNVEINCKKKLSTYAKELVKNNVIIKGYDVQIKFEDFFDSDTYVPFRLMNAFNVIWL